MGEISKKENLELKQKAIALRLAFDKKRKIYKVIYLLIVFIAVIGLMVAIILLFKDKNIDIARNVATVSAIVISIVCFFTSDWVVCNLSKSLKSMQRELNELNREIYPQIFAAQEKNKAIKEKNLADKVKRVIGVSVFVLGCIALITDFVIADIISVEMFLILLLSGIWLVIYSFFVMFSKRLVYGMYYPTMTLLTIAAPPLLTAWLTQNAQAWVTILITCLMTAFGLFLFAVFMYFSVYRPGKESRQFIKDNRDLFEGRESEQEGFMTEILNAKKDRALISVWRNTKHHLIIEKWISNEPPHFEKLKELEFVEYHNAYYAALKEIVGLYKNNDGRAEITLEQRVRKLAEADIKELIEKLQSYDYLKDKIEMIGDDYIVINFHKYLSVNFGDDYCEYFNTHWHPSDNEEAAEFIDDLMNERVIFYQNRLTRKRKQYDGCYLDRLQKTKNKKFCRVYSAMKIYVDR